jgi:hypothetical protein
VSPLHRFLCPREEKLEAQALRLRRGEPEDSCARTKTVRRRRFGDREETLTLDLLLHFAALCCALLNFAALFCTLLHFAALRYFVIFFNARMLRCSALSARGGISGRGQGKGK